MTREEILALLNKAHDIGSVKHADYIDYVVVLEGRRKVNGDWQATEHAYMTIDGKLAMANEDHRKQAKRLDFGEPKVLVDNSEQLTLQVTATSEIYGVRHGTATSRKKTGTNAEKDWPWEVAETSAIGRALAAMGYGLLPGAGLASAEDIILSTAKDMLRGQATNDQSDTNGNGKGNGTHFCAIHQANLEPHGKGFAHRMKGGGWCYGTNNPVTLPPTKHSPVNQTVDAATPSA